MRWNGRLAWRTSAAMPSGAQRLLLASIHDVSPRFESEVDRLLDLVGPHVDGRVAMLVVPNHWGDAPIVRGSPFARRLRGWAAGSRYSCMAISIAISRGTPPLRTGSVRGS